MTLNMVSIKTQIFGVHGNRDNQGGRNFDLLRNHVRQRDEADYFRNLRKKDMSIHQPGQRRRKTMDLPIKCHTRARTLAGS